MRKKRCVEKLIVLAPRVVALGAFEEADLALIGSPELAEPPERKIVLALGTLDLDRGQSPHLLALVIHDHDLLLLAHLFRSHLVVGFDLPDIAAFTALELTSRGDQQRLTLRTEHRSTIGHARRLTLLSSTGSDDV